jgi:hypothetical protein
MGNYNTKVFINIETPEGLQLLSPIRDINIALNTPNTPIHSLEADNVGSYKGNDTYTFSLTVDAIRDNLTGTNPSKVLTKLQAEHTKFKIVMVERPTKPAGGEKDWAFDEMLLEDCLINTGAPTRETLGGIPTATFNGIALGINIDGEFFNGTLPA